MRVIDRQLILGMYDKHVINKAAVRAAININALITNKGVDASTTQDNADRFYYQLLERSIVTNDEMIKLFDVRDEEKFTYVTPVVNKPLTT